DSPPARTCRPRAPGVSGGWPSSSTTSWRWPLRGGSRRSERTSRSSTGKGTTSESFDPDGSVLDRSLQHVRGGSGPSSGGAADEPATGCPASEHATGTTGGYTGCTASRDDAGGTAAEHAARDSIRGCGGAADSVGAMDRRFGQYRGTR